ncbi:hypothetical protein ACIBEJ_06290 [Nonomuraea sp. NPDC050790]|uniref:hypothetical protein n=1 Tax=Nonomuraea sp. NPDC050790 TaxID=3364371 RepID=UPI00379A2182
MAYTSRLSAEEAERIRRWHLRAYEAAKAEAGSGQTFAYPGRTLVVPPEVRPITGMAHLLGEAVLEEVRPGDRVLDMGTGCRGNAVLAASVAAAVLAVNISPVAVELARALVRDGWTVDYFTFRLTRTVSGAQAFDEVV